jgi:hypothetical protein
MISVLFVIAFPPFRTAQADTSQPAPAGIQRAGKTGTQNTAASYRINWF